MKKSICALLATFLGLGVISFAGQDMANKIANAEGEDIVIEDNFRTTKLSDSHVYTYNNMVNYANSSHPGIVGSSWAANINIGDNTTGYMEYKIDASAGHVLETLSLDMNAIIWYSNSAEAKEYVHLANSNVKVYVSTDDSNFGDPVATYTTITSSTERNFTETFDTLVAGKATVYVKIESNIDPEYRLDADHAEGKISLSYMPIKIGNVKLAANEVEGTDPNALAVETIKDDFKTTAVGNSNVYKMNHVGGGANSTHGVIPGPWADPFQAGPGFVMYKVEVPDGATFKSLLLKFNARIWNSAEMNDDKDFILEDNNIEIYASDDEANFGEPRAKFMSTNLSGEQSFSVDLTEYALEKAVFFIKIALNHVEHVMSMSFCGIKLFSVEIVSKYLASAVVETEPYSYSFPIEANFETMEKDNLELFTSSGKILACVDGGYLGYGIIPVSCDQFKQFYSLKMSSSIRCTGYGSGYVPFERGLVCYVSTNGVDFEEVASLDTDTDWTNKFFNVNLSSFVRGYTNIWVKIEINWPSGNNNSRDWIAFGDTTFTGGLVERHVYDINYYNVEDAVNNNPDSYTSGEVVAIGAASKDHYTFAGWFIDEELNTPFEGISETTSGNIDLYAAWTPDAHTLTLNAGLGHFSDQSQTKNITVYYGLPISRSVVETPTSTLSFIDWYKDPSFTTKWNFEEDYGESDIVTEDLTLYAKYDNKVTVKFDYADGVTSSVTFNYIYGDIVEQIADPVREGYVFGGWTLNGTAFDFTSTLVEDITLVALWYKIYSITYTGVEGASFENPSTYILTDGVITLNDASKKGYTFLGWYLNGDKVTSIDASMEKDIELVAKWDENVYNLTITTDEHSHIDCTDTKISFEGKLFKVEVDVGYRISMVTVNNNKADLNADGTFFVGGYDEDVVINVITTESHYCNNSIDLEFGTSARWEAYVYDMFNVARYTGDPASKYYGWLTTSDHKKEGYIIYAIDVGEGKSINTLNVTGTARIFTYEGSMAKCELLVSKDGINYESVNDYPNTTDGGKTTDIDANITSMVKGAQVVYLKYIIASGNYDWVCLNRMKADITFSTVTVTYKDGNNVIATNENQVKGDTIDLIEDPEKNGYTFLGWYSDETLRKPVDENTVVDEDLTLYAKWSLNTYEITYIVDGGDIGDNVESYTIEDEIILNEAYKNNCKFAGWYLSEDFSGEAITKIEKGTYGNITLYAKFIEGTKINYVLNGGENSELNPEVYFSDETTDLFDPYREGYVFGGWYLDENFTELVDCIEEGTTGEVTLYAMWIEDIDVDSSEETSTTISSGEPATSSVNENSSQSQDEPKSGGCGGSIAAASGLITLLSIAGLVLLKKKER